MWPKLRLALSLAVWFRGSPCSAYSRQPTAGYRGGGAQASARSWGPSSGVRSAGTASGASGIGCSARRSLATNEEGRAVEELDISLKRAEPS
jgi:hypothetical protein